MKTYIESGSEEDFDDSTDDYKQPSGSSESESESDHSQLKEIQAKKRHKKKQDHTDPVSNSNQVDSSKKKLFLML